MSNSSIVCYFTEEESKGGSVYFVRRLTFSLLRLGSAFPFPPATQNTQ